MNVRFSRTLMAGAALALFGGVLAPAAAHAQAQTSGTRFGVEADLADHHQGFGVGAFGKFHLAEISEHAITGRVNFDYFFPSSSNFGGYSYHLWMIEGSGLLDIVTSGDTKPYVGAGLTYGHSSWGNGYCDIVGVDCSGSSTDLHILGGVNFMGNSKLMPFAEAKLILSGGSSLILRGGIHF